MLGESLMDIQDNLEEDFCEEEEDDDDDDTRLQQALHRARGHTPSLH